MKDVETTAKTFLGVVQQGCDKVTTMIGGYRPDYQEAFGGKSSSGNGNGGVNIVGIFSHKLGKLTGHNKAELTEGIEDAARAKGKKGDELVALLNNYCS